MYIIIGYHFATSKSSVSFHIASNVRTYLRIMHLLIVNLVWMNIQFFWFWPCFITPFFFYLNIALLDNYFFIPNLLLDIAKRLISWLIQKIKYCRGGTLLDQIFGLSIQVTLHFFKLSIAIIDMSTPIVPNLVENYDNDNS